MLRALALSLLVVTGLLAPATEAHARGKLTLGPAKDHVLTWFKPNLVVDSLSVIEGSGDVVQKVTGRATVRNTGLTHTGPCGVSTYTTIDGKLVIQHFWLSQGLAPGQSYVMSWKLPGALYNTKQTYAMSVFADPYDSVDELSESDNQASLLVTK